MRILKLIIPINLALTLTLYLSLTVTLPMTSTDNPRNIYPHFTRLTSASAHLIVAFEQVKSSQVNGVIHFAK